MERVLITRLAVACGLHKIASSVWTPPVPISLPLLHTLRTGSYALEPPIDAVDLGERINALYVALGSNIEQSLILSWTVYEADQCTFISYQWDPMLRVNEILTPLPRPMQDYGSVWSPDGCSAFADA